MAGLVARHLNNTPLLEGIRIHQGMRAGMWFRQYNPFSWRCWSRTYPFRSFDMKKTRTHRGWSSILRERRKYTRVSRTIVGMFQVDTFCSEAQTYLEDTKRNWSNLGRTCKSLQYTLGTLQGWWHLEPLSMFLYCMACMFLSH